MTDLGPVTARLKALREHAKMTVRATAEALDMPSSTYAAYEDPKKFKKSLLPLHLAERLADIFEPHGTPRDLIMGLAGVTASGALKAAPEDLADRLDAVLLPEIEVGYSMGGGADISDYPVTQMVPFSRAWLSNLTHSPASMLFVARGDGDSMMPTLLDQDIVIIDRSQQVMKQQDRIWAVSYAGFGMIKRLRQLPDGTLQINSDNPAVSPIIASDGEAFLIGRVVGVIRRI
ncbi:phage repressor protein C with HTH and peptisase S24 domain [Hephaestia caeni]|uniref:Phage repressor protein C with HTH and peptisase S24 domain n=1 Tax=Hephaestia caeni TaxID=645617 RepID=A0A397NPC3_9SPHN|nr:S24 family peptidase [Hephaestia caeni]RIA37503.1 phage repressor protein C with HTH and peptisase S24 domain [Hephaestia caeni]